MAQIYLLAVTLNVWVLVPILAAAFGAQLWMGEPPCPLCMIQRIALMLAGLGLLRIPFRARSSVVTCSAAAVGQGMAIIAALLGGVGWPASLYVVLHRIRLPDRRERRHVDCKRLARWRQASLVGDNDHDRRVCGGRRRQSPFGDRRGGSPLAPAGNPVEYLLFK